MKIQKTSTSKPLADRARWLALGVVMSIILSTGFVYGRYSQRWGPPADLKAAAAHLETMPKNFGRWELVDEAPIAKSAVDMLECAGYVNRRYVDLDSGQSVSIAIIVGPPGPTAVHTPEICFSSRAYELKGDRRLVRLEGRQVVVIPFGEWTSPVKTFCRTSSACSMRGVAARTGRRRNLRESSLGRAPFLYKIQLAAAIPPWLGDDQTDIGRKFLEDLAHSGWEFFGDLNLRGDS